jgi:hypothetical protein
MVNRRTLLLLGTLLGVLPLSSCTPLYQLVAGDETILKPPEDGDKAAAWWRDTIDKAPMEFLSVFAEAADRHRTAGTSATYEVFVGEHEVNGVASAVTYRLQCPPPPGADALIRQRIAGYLVTAEPDGQWSARSARSCNRCTSEHAMRIWQEAKATVMGQGAVPRQPAGAR